MGGFSEKEAVERAESLVRAGWILRRQEELERRYDRLKELLVTPAAGNPDALEVDLLDLALARADLEAFLNTALPVEEEEGALVDRPQPDGSAVLCTEIGGQTAAETRPLRHERLVQRAEEIISAAQSAALQSFEADLPDLSGTDEGMRRANELTRATPEDTPVLPPNGGPRRFPQERIEEIRQRRAESRRARLQDGVIEK